MPASTSAATTEARGGDWTWRRALQPAVFVLCAAPFLLLLWDAARGDLGANPVEAITHRTGRWGLRFLLITLAVTPVRLLTGWNALIRHRRMLGLYAFFYVTLHFLTYIVLDQFFGFAYIIEDIAERPYITVGFTSWLLLVPLALTSTDASIRRLGKRWGKLHRLVYVAAAGGVFHFLWLVKADLRRPVLYGSVLVVLLTLRLVPTATFRRLRGVVRRRD